MTLALRKDSGTPALTYTQAACRECPQTSRPCISGDDVDVPREWHEQHVRETGHRQLALRTGLEWYYRA